jgi:hypothetical protein
MFTIDNDTNKMTIIRKDTASFNIALENYELGNGDTVTFTIAKEKEQESPLVQIIVTEFLNGVATVFLESANTDLDEGTYLYDVQINTADGRVDTVVGPAKFKVIGGVTY